MRILHRTLVLLQYIKSYSVYKLYNYLIFCNMNSYIQYLHLAKSEGYAIVNTFWWCFTDYEL